MKINNVDLSVMAVRRSQYPVDRKPEFLLVGRSNVGKSSFINTLIERKNFARTSSKPGKTRTLNFYDVDNKFYLVDVPGYGFASVSKTMQKKFGMMIEEYLESRKFLKQVFMLVDFRHAPTEDDVLMYKFLKYYDIPVTIVATKIDKVGKSRLHHNRKVIIEALDLVVEDEVILFSAITKIGKNDILDKIERLI